MFFFAPFPFVSHPRSHILLVFNPTPTAVVEKGGGEGADASGAAAADGDEASA